MRVDVAARCSMLLAASVASTRMATAMRAWRTVAPATVPTAASAAIRTDWAWRLRAQEVR